jgi:hypothetical protein
VRAVAALDAVEALDLAGDHVPVLLEDIVVAVVGDGAGRAGVLDVVVAAGSRHGQPHGNKDE